MKPIWHSDVICRWNRRTGWWPTRSKRNGTGSFKLLPKRGWNTNANTRSTGNCSIGKSERRSWRLYPTSLASGMILEHRCSGRRMKFTGQIIGALRKGNRLKSRYERLRERGMLDVTEMAALLGTSMRTVYIWHRQGQLQPHRYNDSGAYLYEAPEADSPLRSQDRK